MNNVRCFEIQDGFCLDYIFSYPAGLRCFRVYENNDYFSFCVFSENLDLEGECEIKLEKGNVMFEPFLKLLDGNKKIEVLEEGSNGGKSVIFEEVDGAFVITLVLADEPTSVSTVSITNVRASSPDVLFGEAGSKIADFKNKLHFVLGEIKNKVCEEVEENENA